MRRRSHSLTIRMDDAEYMRFQQKILESELTVQGYVLGAVLDSEITSADAVHEMQEANATLADIDRQLHGMGTNVNQLARIANTYGDLPETATLEEIDAKLIEFRGQIGKEMKRLWQSLKQSSIRPKNTEE